MDARGAVPRLRVLVCAASKYGSTFEIAQEIGSVLAERGVSCDVSRLEDVDDLGRYDAVVLGSGVYAGGWLKSASRFAVRHEGELARRRVWLFSSGPLGEVLPQLDDPRQIPDLYAAIDASDHRMFGGKLDRDDVRAFDRLLIRFMRAPYGDYRDWDEIRAWANEIADRLDG